MSLILDALKRAERERQLGQSPAAFGGGPLPSPPPPEKPGRGGLLTLLAVIALVAVAAYVWLRPERGEPAITAAQPEPAAAQRPASEAPASSSGIVSAQIEGGGEIVTFDDLTGDARVEDDPVIVEDGNPPATQVARSGSAPPPQVAPGPTLFTPSGTSQPAPAAAEQPPRAAEAPVQLAAAVPAPAPIVLSPAPQVAATASGADEVEVRAESADPRSIPSGPILRIGPDGETIVVEEPAAPATAPAPAQTPAPRELPAPAPALQRPRRLKEMPAPYRAEFPTLSVDVHVYNADPQRRFALINGKRYREGDMLAEGPRIAEIVSDGLVVDWHNERVIYTLNR